MDPNTIWIERIGDWFENPLDEAAWDARYDAARDWDGPDEDDEDEDEDESDPDEE